MKFWKLYKVRREGKGTARRIDQHYITQPSPTQRRTQGEVSNEKQKARKSEELDNAPGRAGWWGKKWTNSAHRPPGPPKYQKMNGKQSVMVSKACSMRRCRFVWQSGRWAGDRSRWKTQRGFYSLSLLRRPRPWPWPWL